MQLANGSAYVFGNGPHDLHGLRIEHVAHALSQINRFTGHTREPYSVAQHSVFVSKLLDFDPRLAMLGLAHDAHEIIIGDIGTPLKLALKAEGAAGILGLLEAQADAVLYPLFGVNPTASDFDREAIKRADLVALATEYRDLMVRRHDWNLPHPPSRTKIVPVPAHIAAQQFMRRFRQLKRQVSVKPSSGRRNDVGTKRP
ncbi:metal-dependent phosphohydrolase [Hyphomicrobium sulfonivorans]|nr:metal-dependent phosphohydrolase [Hyphomicrobium sulfonivorans]